MNGSNDGNGNHVRFDSDNLSDLTSSMVTASAGHGVPSPPPKDTPSSSSSIEQQNHHPLASPPPPHMAATPPATRYQAKDLRSNLMRELVDRDPLFNYEVVKVLGVGSMGSVAKVRKRGHTVGGSARRELQQHFSREKKLRECGNIPIFGSIFQHCLGFIWKSTGVNNSDSNSTSSGRHHHSSSANSTTSSILNPKGNLLETVEEDEEGRYQLVYAMKSIHLSRVTDPAFVEELRNEVKILKTLDHPHIVRPIETYEHRNQIFIVMEICSGGDLYSRDPYSEAEAARIVASILSAISYMHSKNISHRDLKYENIMFINDDPKAEIKLIDFGLSKKFGPDEDLTEGVGTIYTMAPEVLKGKYTQQADLWSIGVIAYMLLSSQMPFFGRKRRHIVEAIMKGTFDFKGRRWKRLSAQSKEFVKSLLVVDPEERMDADEALGAVWLNRRMTATVRNPYEDELEGAQRSMIKYAKYSKLKKMALMVVAHKSTTQEIGILRKVFQKYDTTRDGQLSYDEFKAALSDAGFADEECEQIFHNVDLDGTGTVRYTEFLAATIEAQGAISEERLAEAFDRIDSDDSGYISAENLKELLGKEFPKEEIDAIIKEADITNDGKISYSEFLALWEDKNETKHHTNMRQIRELAEAYNNESDRSSIMSDHTSEEDGQEVAARANFLKEKRSSERKAATSPTAVSGDQKHVGFNENVQTIPTITYDDGTDPVMNDAGETLELNEPVPVAD